MVDDESIICVQLNPGLVFHRKLRPDAGRKTVYVFSAHKVSAMLSSKAFRLPGTRKKQNRKMTNRLCGVFLIVVS